jgi:tripartite ATP-independent transporter DctM subunit
MEWWMILIITVVLLMSFFLSGMPVAFAFLLFNIVATLLWMGPKGLELLPRSILPAISVFDFVCLPMFCFMGELLLLSGIAKLLIDAVAVWIGGIRGSLALVSVLAGTVFGAMSGSGMSSVAVLGSTLVPEMRARGYSKEMSIGPILCAGGLATIIPPTTLGIILASLAKLSVGKYLVSLFIPGFILAGSYAVYILLRAKLQPHLAPPFAPEHVTWTDRLKSLTVVVPISLVIFLVTGVLFLGIATPSEAATLGVSGAFILGLAYRRLTWKIFKDSISETARVACMMLSIIVGSLMFSQLLAYTGATPKLVDVASTLPVHPLIVVFAMQILVLILGCFIDGISIIMITIPLFFPVIKVLGFDPIWFGVLMLINIEVGFITPPFGTSLFVMKGVVPDVSMRDIYVAGLPFIAVDFVCIFLMTVFPKLITWTSGLMG